MAPRLNILEIENFKTYLGKHIIGPLQSFTAIVGPNGGGKSNIMDAVAFVLGERVTALRVKNGNELIHRERVCDDASSILPAGPVTASVTAIFMLTDGSQLAFKRVVSSGGSEFFVEGERISFGHYQERLQGLGVNVHCWNFMVFQGSVESIVMHGSRQKTELFEELSGSSALSREYNRLKKELARAEEEVMNVFEERTMMVGQYKDLKEDRKKAKEYEGLEKQCEKKKIKLQLFRLYHITNEQTSLEEEVKMKENDLKQLKEKERKQAQLVEKKLEERSMAVQEATRLEQNVEELETQLRSKHSELITAKECLLERKKKEEICLKLLSKAKEAQEDHHRKVEELKEKLKETENLAAQYEAELSVEALKMGTSVELEGNQLHQYHQLKQEAGQRCATLQQNLDCISRQLKTQLHLVANENRRVEEGQEALRRKGEEVKEAKRRMDRLIESLKGITQCVMEKQLLLKELEKEVTNKRDKQEHLRAQLEAWTKQLNEATWDIGQAEKRREKQERVELLREMYPGVLNRLKNLCQPLHSRYQLAITRVLLKHLDSIVTDTVATARSCMEYLVDKRIGRETFLPLSYLQPRPLMESLRAIQEPVHVRLAFDLIKFEPPEVKVAVLFATKDTLICETPEDAMKVAYEIGENRLSAVALDGTFYGKSGLMSGGKLELEEKAKAWGEKNVAKMRSTKNSLMEELREVQNVAREESEMKTVEAQVRGQEAQVKYTSLEADKLRKEIKEMEEEQKKMEDELKTHTDCFEEMKAAVAERGAEVMEIQAEMEMVENEVFMNFCREIGVPNIRQYEEQGLQALMKQADTRLNFEKQKSRIMSLIEYEQSRDMEGGVEKWETAVTTQTKAVEEARENEKAKINAMEAAIKKVAEGKSKMIEKKRAVREAEEGVEIAQEKARVARRGKEKMQSRVFHIKQKIAALKVDRHNILKQCHIKGLELPLVSGSLKHALQYSMDSSMSSSTMETPSQGQMSESMDQSEENIQVNFSSLSNLYKQLEMDEQRKKVEGDIATGISGLEKTLAAMQAPSKNTGEHLMQMSQKVKAMEITLKEKQQLAKDAKEAFQDVQKQRHRLFMDCFTSVSTSIDKFYKALCRSTSAQAVLETDNPEEPYLGSIIYHCIPPGKRCQNMWSLSGGEKAMASLAFLFTLHSYHPTPFFILDEVDAALDKMNISKVSSYLRDHKEEVQILIISHKEDMYRKANTLFGITRKIVNEYGHSRVFSLDLTQYRHNLHRQPRQQPPASATMKLRFLDPGGQSWLPLWHFAPPVSREWSHWTLYFNTTRLEPP